MTDTPGSPSIDELLNPSEADAKLTAGVLCHFVGERVDILSAFTRYVEHCPGDLGEALVLGVLGATHDALVPGCETAVGAQMFTSRPESAATREQALAGFEHAIRRCLEPLIRRARGGVSSSPAVETFIRRATGAAVLLADELAKIRQAEPAAGDGEIVRRVSALAENWRNSVPGSIYWAFGEALHETIVGERTEPPVRKIGYPAVLGDDGTFGQARERRSARDDG